MCTIFAPRVTHIRARRHIPLSLIKELSYQLMENTKDLDLIEELEDLLDRIKSASPGSCSTASSRRSSLESCDSVRLESGIYLIRNRHDSEDSFEDGPLQAGDDAASMVTLKVPDGPFYATDMASDTTEDDCSGEVFTSSHHNVPSEHSESISEVDGNRPDSIEYLEMHDIQQTVESVSSDSSSKDRADSQISAESASEIDANAMQVVSKASSINSSSTPQLSTTTNLSHNRASTNSENQWDNVPLNEPKTTPLDANMNQSLASSDLPSQGEDPSITTHPHQSDSVTEQLEDSDIVSCVGLRTTPSPDEPTTQIVPLWNQNPADETASTEQSRQKTHTFESSIDSDIIQQYSESNSLESVESVPSSEPSAVPIPSTADSSVPSHFDDVFAKDTSLTQPPVPHPLRRTMSVPTAMVEADTNPVVVRRRSSEIGNTGKEKKKKKKKRKSRIAEIGKLNQRLLQAMHVWKCRCFQNTTKLSIISPRGI